MENFDYSDRKYHIGVIKHDKYLNGRFYISRGFINPMPAATSGFRTISEALLAIRCLEKVKGDGKRWWRLWYRVSGVTQRHRAETHRNAKNMGMVAKFKGNDTYHLSYV